MQPTSWNHFQTRYLFPDQNVKKPYPFGAAHKHIAIGYTRKDPSGSLRCYRGLHSFNCYGLACLLSACVAGIIREGRTKKSERKRGDWGEGRGNNGDL